MNALADRFIFMLLLSSLVFVSCGDDTEEDEEDTAIDQQDVIIDRHSDSLNDVVIDGETVYRYPRFSKFYSDTRFEYYYLWHQCFQYGENHGGKLIVQSRNDGIVEHHNLDDLDGDTLVSGSDQSITVPRITVEGRFWGCFVKAVFSGRVTCRGDLSYERSYNDKWGDLTGTTRTAWDCSLTQPRPSDPTKKLRYKQQVACEGLLMNPPNSDQGENCEVRSWEYSVDDWGAISVNGASALFDHDSHLGAIDGLDDWDASCCREQGGDQETVNYLKIYEASTMAMKQAMLAVWSEAGLLWGP